MSIPGEGGASAVAPNREHGAGAAAEPHDLSFQAAGLAAQEVSLEATCAAAMPCGERSAVRGEVCLVPLRLQRRPGFLPPWRRVRVTSRLGGAAPRSPGSWGLAGF